LVSWPCCSTLSPRASLAADARVPRGALESLATSAEEDGLAGVDGDGDEDEDGERGLHTLVGLLGCLVSSSLDRLADVVCGLLYRNVRRLFLYREVWWEKRKTY